MVITTLFGIAVIGGYLVLDTIFPKANPISCPTEESVTAITLVQNHNRSLAVETTDIRKILKNITDAVPTREPSVNDYPAAKTYYVIEVDTAARQYRYFLYIQNSQVYMELPYEGVYKSSQQFFDSISEYFKD
jgi:hypothetical protein